MVIVEVPLRISHQRNQNGSLLLQVADIHTTPAVPEKPDSIRLKQFFPGDDLLPLLPGSINGKALGCRPAAICFDGSNMLLCSAGNPAF
jgi:hypothetical protein